MTTGRAQHPTIKDIARQSGVSIKTVSRVMNNEAGVRAATAERVRLIAERLGYAVNLAARQLKTRRTGSIGIMVYASTHWQWTADLVAGALVRARERNYGLAPFILQQYEATEREAVLWLASRHAVDGVILTTPWNESPRLRNELRERGMPYVLLPAPAGLAEPGVRSDDAGGAAMLVRHLLELGHRRIGFVGGQKEISLTRERLAGIDTALGEAGLRRDPAMTALGDYSFERGYAEAERLLALDPRPTALLCFSDLLGAAALKAAHDRNLRVPLEISIVGMGDQLAGQIVWPALTTVAIPTEEMAGRAVDLLLDEIEGAATPPRTVLFETTLIVRQSSGPAPS